MAADVTPAPSGKAKLLSRLFCTGLVYVQRKYPPVIAIVEIKREFSTG
jgi:hypothetical protein